MTDMEIFRTSALDRHNACRQMHGVSPVKLNGEINQVSQKWAIHLAKNDLFEHSKERPYQGKNMGENIAKKYSSDPKHIYTGEDATNQWYNEVERYNFEIASGPKTGHFTQVVWKTCTEIGIGRARTKKGTWIVVVNYHPAGNWKGRYHDNVPPPVNGMLDLPSKGDNKRQSHRRKVTDVSRQPHHSKHASPTQSSYGNRCCQTMGREGAKTRQRRRDRSIDVLESKTRKERRSIEHSYYVDDEAEKRTKHGAGRRKKSYFTSDAKGKGTKCTIL